MQLSAGYCSGKLQNKRYSNYLKEPRGPVEPISLSTGWCTSSTTFRRIWLMTNCPDASRIGRVLFRLRSLTPIPFILVLIFLSRLAPFPLVFGSLLIALGEWLRIWAVGYAGGSTRTRSLGIARDLVTTGPYAHVRNPLYLGNFVLSIGVCVFANVYWMIAVLVIGFLIQYTPIILSEETYLLKLCGDRYRTYVCNCASPHSTSLVRTHYPPDHDFSLHRALKSEKRTLTAIGCVTILIAARSFLR